MSAVIYAAIVVMWAVVLVPMWLRRHDAATESRSVDRFSTAMRTLSRRTTSGPGRRYVVMPRRSEGGVSVHVSGAAVPPERPVSPARPSIVVRALRAHRARAARTSLVARRRRLLLGLLVVTFLTMLLAATGLMSWTLQLVLDVFLAAFCVHLRAQARRAAAVSRQRRRPPVAPAPRRPAGRPAAQRQPARTASAVPAEQPLAATGTEDGTWEPVPVPRPTYTLKPPAPVEVPSDVIDPLRDTDPYNTMAAVSDDALAPGAEVIAAEPAVIDSDLEDILDRRWAVND
jgi:hypothetical protein